MQSSPLPPPVDSLMCGLFDAVAGGWYQQNSNELFAGYPIAQEDKVLDFGCGGGGAANDCGKTGADI